MLMSIYAFKIFNPVVTTRLGGLLCPLVVMEHTISRHLCRCTPENPQFLTYGSTTSLSARCFRIMRNFLKLQQDHAAPLWMSLLVTFSPYQSTRTLHRKIFLIQIKMSLQAMNCKLYWIFQMTTHPFTCAQEITSKDSMDSKFKRKIRQQCTFLCINKVTWY